MQALVIVETKSLRSFISDRHPLSLSLECEPLRMTERKSYVHEQSDRILLQRTKIEGIIRKSSYE